MSYKNNTGLPSVTQIISCAGAYWIPSQYFTQESRDRGSAVHAWCAAYAQKQYSIPLVDDWRGYCRSFVLWHDTYAAKVMVVERRLTSSMGYCGQLDLALLMEGSDGTGLVDLKTGSYQKHSHDIQIAAYRNLLAENGIPTKWGGVLTLKQNGTMARLHRTAKDYSADLNIFIGMMNTFNHFGGERK